MITMLIAWCLISFLAFCASCALAWRIWSMHYGSRAMQRLFIQKCGHALFNAIVVVVVIRSADNTTIGTPASLNVVLFTLGYTIQVVTSVQFSLYALGLLNGGQLKIKDVNHAETE